MPYAAAVGVVSALADAVRGRTLIDCTNPVAPGFVLETRGGPSAAERIATAAPGASVVKAFNLCHESVWRLTPPVFDGRPLAVPLCGDDVPALDTVRLLVRDLGCVPVDGGGLDRAALLEATAALLIGLWVGEGVDAQAIAPPLEYAGRRRPGGVPRRDPGLKALPPARPVGPRLRRARPAPAADRSPRPGVEAGPGATAEEARRRPPPGPRCVAPHDEGLRPGTRDGDLHPPGDLDRQKAPFRPDQLCISGVPGLSVPVPVPP